MSGYSPCCGVPHLERREQLDRHLWRETECVHELSCILLSGTLYVSTGAFMQQAAEGRCGKLSVAINGGG